MQKFKKEILFSPLQMVDESVHKMKLLSKSNIAYEW